MRSSRHVRPEDRTVRARIRDAAIELIAERGLDSLTARAVADRAGVSAGSVINNFGSMAGLREACDDFVAMVVREQESAAMSEGDSLDFVGALRDAGLAHLLAYLAAVLADDSPALARLIDSMATDAEAYLEGGVAAGTIRPTDDPRGRAIVLLLSSLGPLMLHRHLHRLLGVDLTAPNADPATLANYVGPTYELYTHGLFTPEFGAAATTSVAALRAGSHGPAQPSTRSGGLDDSGGIDV